MTTTALSWQPKIQTIPVKPSALMAMATRFDMDPQTLLTTLKNTVFKGATNEQLAALVIVANEHRLNPFTREIYAFPDKSGGIQAVIGVDGWIRIITSNPNFNGVEFAATDDTCTCKMHVKGREYPVIVTEYLSECKRNTDPWRTYPKRMLRHKALIQAGRVAFGLGALRDEDEVSLHPASATVSPVLPESILPPQVEMQAEPESAEPETERAPATPSTAPEPLHTVQQTLAEVVAGNGYTFDDFAAWARETGNFDAKKAEPTCFDEVDQATCKRLLRSTSGLLSGIARVKGVEA